jgi:Tfp pilus assembly protein PilP
MALNKTYLSLFFILLLSACSSDSRELNTYIAKLKQSTKAEKQKALTPVKIPKPATYQASNLRTPFELTESMAVDKNAGAKNPLQAHPITMLRFVGTLSENNTTAAYVMTPDNKVYQIKNNDIIGNHHGTIVGIYPDRIEIMEKETDDAKHPTQRLVTLQLKE